MISDISRRFCGVIVLTIPTIVYGGYFLLTVLTGQQQDLQLSEFQRAMFRAGHAHAGVIVILSLVVQILCDSSVLPRALTLYVRVTVPLSAILISAGFFLSAIGIDVQRPNQFITLIYVGAILLVAALIILGIGLLRAKGNNA